MSKLILTDIHAEFVDISIKEEAEMRLSYWIVEYKVYHTKGHYWRGVVHWNERDCIIDDVLAAIKKELPKDIE